MNTIVLNNELSCIVESFNKNTSFEGENVTSTGYATLLTSDITELNTLARDTITSIKLLHDDDVIYNSTGLNAKITVLNEYLNGDHVNINVNFTFA